MKTVFVDTNVFLYAVGADHPLRPACRAALERLGTGELAGTTSAEVVREIAYVLGRRGGRKEALALSRHILGLFPGPLPVTREDTALAIELLERQPTLSTRDAVHAATMVTNGIREIVSVDRHFDEVPEVVRLDPSLLHDEPGPPA